MLNELHSANLRGIVSAAAGAAIGMVLTPVVTPIVLELVGFSANGVVAGEFPSQSRQVASNLKDHQAQQQPGCKLLLET
jgi:hypothetical protein